MLFTGKRSLTLSLGVVIRRSHSHLGVVVGRGRSRVEHSEIIQCVHTAGVLNGDLTFV